MFVVVSDTFLVHNLSSNSDCLIITFFNLQLIGFGCYMTTILNFDMTQRILVHLKCLSDHIQYKPRKIERIILSILQVL